METTTETKRYCLSNKNYATWATMMKAELYGLGLMEFVKKEEVSGTSRTGANNTDLETNKLKVYVLLMKHLDEEHVAIVNSKIPLEKEGDGLAVWELFKKKYAGNEAHHQMLACSSKSRNPITLQ
ncbi:hypothetical protein PPACK8108_LOCUS20229 [Phakopsora pachyrhizi]|uniref:DUF4219 domain-containing protein n=1 Tax=Phakopsora pachyrhizi TaxID=170000 RepID=A0AAV0BEY2_PHAPC|nr:hypothetical protein PPACK8108_LOCUS20229 [Phakopsora pachyrhizi]